MIPDKHRVPGTRQTAASATKASSSHKGCGAWKTQTFSAFNMAVETLFADLIFREDGHCEQIDMNWIAAGMPHQLARLAKHGTDTRACSSSMANFVQRCSHSCSEPEQAT